MEHQAPVTTDGAWIFLSHSHKDLEKVRLVRNELERKGHNPILFFLKCLDDEDAALPDLLRREIEARNWFLLCDSPHSRTSRYVQDEVAIIKSLKGKVFETIDLSADLETQLDTIDRLSQRATVFVYSEECYADIAARIIDELKHSEFRVMTNLSHPSPDSMPLAEIRSEIDEALRSGYLLVLFGEQHGPRRLADEVVKYSRYKTQNSYRGNIGPVRVSPLAGMEDMPEELAYYQWFDISSGNQQHRIIQLVHDLRERQLR
jgi:hypothetical protein